MRLLRALQSACLDGRRALLVGAELAVVASRFAHCDQVPAPVDGSFALESEIDLRGSYDFIGLMHVLEYFDDDRGDFDRLLGLLSPGGLLQAVFADAGARPWTSIRSGRRGSVRRMYGRDVLNHFRGPGPLFLSVREEADPVTGVVQQAHFFYRDPRRYADLLSETT